MGSNDFGEIKSSYATGSVSGGKYIGGLAGCNNDGAIRSSYATGSVSGDTIKVGGLDGYQVGGLAGNNGGSVTASYATGSVRGKKYVGGLVGKNDEGSISASYSASEVTGGQYIGGLVGGNEGMVGYGYAVGKVSSDGAIDGPQRYIGGLAGYNPGIIHYGLWDTESSGPASGWNRNRNRRRTVFRHIWQDHCRASIGRGIHRPSGWNRNRNRRRTVFRHIWQDHCRASIGRGIHRPIPGLGCFPVYRGQGEHSGLQSQ